jgi:hypothetical protein
MGLIVFGVVWTSLGGYVVWSAASHSIRSRPVLHGGPFGDVLWDRIQRVGGVPTIIVGIGAIYLGLR